MRFPERQAAIGLAIFLFPILYTRVCPIVIKIKRLQGTTVMPCFGVMCRSGVHVGDDVSMRRAAPKYVFYGKYVFSVKTDD